MSFNHKKSVRKSAISGVKAQDFCVTEKVIKMQSEWGKMMKFNLK